MDEGNQTSVTEFILLGITNLPQIQNFLFITFLLFYLFTLLGNLSIVTVVITDQRLHTPMYFLLGNLSFLDFFYSSTTVPKMLSGLLMEDKRISFQSCIAQLHVFHFLGSTEALLLTSMSYDRYIAICYPLRYHVLMAKSVCIQLTSSSWIIGFVYSLSHTILTSKLPFCKLNKVSHFFCDIKPLLKLACVDTHLNESLVSIVTGFVALSTFLLIVISYVFIGTHLLKIRSSQGRRKAFSTCTSHVTVVLLYYGTAFCTYLRPATQDSLEQDRLTAILFTVITPALNPLIYALRNKEVKRSLKKVFLSDTVFQRIPA
ncbi:olfactory receptor 12D1-like [Ascaphus truei]|uniref:olfactory receptor 12D1-like n=1 Tax=Ascaphus truei TaxID=8439 RepID=UPI003F5AA1EB